MEGPADPGTAPSGARIRRTATAAEPSACRRRPQRTPKWWWPAQKAACSWP